MALVKQLLARLLAEEINMAPALRRIKSLFVTLELCGRRNLSVAVPLRASTKGEKSSQYAQGETHFGFETVKEEEKSSKGRLGCLFTPDWRTVPI